jgi:hypothetical protein
VAGCASKAWEIQYEHERTFKPTVALANCLGFAPAHCFGIPPGNTAQRGAGQVAP